MITLIENSMLEVEPTGQRGLQPPEVAETLGCCSIDTPPSNCYQRGTYRFATQYLV